MGRKIIASTDAESAKRRLLAEMEAEAREVARATGRSRLSPRVLEAFSRVPRDAFVPADLVATAWENRPLPIGYEQTISQPFMVVLMTDLLDLTPADRVLEIGTGSGYQCALLAELAAHVYTVERVAELSETAQTALTTLGYGNIDFRIGDGHEGWAEHAPYDAIIVTAAAALPPPKLIDQLAPTGRMIIPLGNPGLWATQTLSLVTRDSAGAPVIRPLIAVAFVPLLRDKA